MIVSSAISPGRARQREAGPRNHSLARHKPALAAAPYAARPVAIELNFVFPRPLRQLGDGQALQRLNKISGRYHPGFLCHHSVKLLGGFLNTRHPAGCILINELAERLSIAMSISTQPAGAIPEGQGRRLELLLTDQC
jgi:hypothetical protein